MSLAKALSSPWKLQLFELKTFEYFIKKIKIIIMTNRLVDQTNYRLVENRSNWELKPLYEHSMRAIKPFRGILKFFLNLSVHYMFFTAMFCPT